MRTRYTWEKLLSELPKAIRYTLNAFVQLCDERVISWEIQLLNWSKVILMHKELTPLDTS